MASKSSVGERHWKEDKVLTITSCLKGDGGEKPPVKLVNTCVATMEDAHAFGKLSRLEAEKRGIRKAVEVIGIHDGGNWIDPVPDLSIQRLADQLGHHRIGREAIWQMR